MEREREVGGGRERHRARGSLLCHPGLLWRLLRPAAVHVSDDHHAVTLQRQARRAGGGGRGEGAPGSTPDPGYRVRPAGGQGWRVCQLAWQNLSTWVRRGETKDWHKGEGPFGRGETRAARTVPELLQKTPAAVRKRVVWSRGALRHRHEHGFDGGKLIRHGRRILRGSGWLRADLHHRVHRGVCDQAPRVRPGVVLVEPVEHHRRHHRHLWRLGAVDGEWCRWRGAPAHASRDAHPGGSQGSEAVPGVPDCVSGGDQRRGSHWELLPGVLPVHHRVCHPGHAAVWGLWGHEHASLAL
mmetsp:Transcript_3956/g.17495  ORF Transcript_3956/g.17495 Transcript_3956/m.17495 type:complete len:298 (+) Transcript_3956:955-1848(+)